MEILKKMNWGDLKHEYQLDGKRLLPWKGWEMPFGGAWCVVRKNTESLRHSHDEQEMFVIVSGNSKIKFNDELYELSKGDFIAIPPNTEHHIINDTEDDFHFFTLWWDEETVSNFQNKVKN